MLRLVIPQQSSWDRYSWHLVALIVWAKRLERGRFAPIYRQKREGGLELSPSECALLLEGSERVGRYGLSPPLLKHRDARCRGRKNNHYGSRSERGTQVAAMMYWLVETAKINRVDPELYLKLAALESIGGRPIPLPHQLGWSLENRAFRALGRRSTRGSASSYPLAT